MPYGLSTPDLTQFDALAPRLARKPTYFMYYKQWVWDTGFDAGFASSVRSRGMIPDMTWEPWDPTKGIGDTTFAPDRIAAGDFDGYLRSYAAAVKAWGQPIRINFAHEMNGNWYPWGYQATSPDQYKAMYRHVVNIFKAIGAANVTWVWAPNVPSHGENVTDWYPGPRVVSVVGIDGYNWGTTQSWGSTWTSFADVFLPAYNQIRAKIPHKPIYISETASTEVGGDKAAWIADMKSTLESLSMPVAGFTWFSYDKETDWRVDSSPTSLDAFNKLIFS